MLDGWLALAAETRRVDRLSSTLGLDTPSFQNSPSSLGSSRGSSGLNTPSQNAFRFLPFLNDVSPELLKSSSFDFGHLPEPLSRRRSSQSQRNGQGTPQIRRPAGRSRASCEVADSPLQPDWKSPKLSRVHPYHTGHPHAPARQGQRPSIHSNHHMSYPAWPVPKPISPLSTDFNVNASPSTSSSIYGVPNSPPGYPRNAIGSRYADGSIASDFDFGHAITDSISPMLSEPFHRLIVKDEEESTDLSNVPMSSQRDGGNMNTVPEEDEDLSSWWRDDARDMPFEFEATTEFQTTTLLDNSLGRPWIPPKGDFNTT